MIKASKRNMLSLLFIAVIYLAWSQIALYQYREALETEKTRVYNIADHLELWKKISTEYDGYFDLEKLGKDQRNIKITQIKRKNETSFIDEDKILYVMFYNEIDEQRKNELNRFFSDLVLGNYFYVTTDKNGKIKEMFWDKP